MSAQERRELFAAATGCDVGRAQFYIDNAGGDLEAAITAYLDAPASASASQQPSRSTGATGGQSSGTTGSRAYRPSGSSNIATFSSLRADEGQSSHNEYYAGGEKSGIAVQGGTDGGRPSDAFAAMQQHHTDEQGGGQKVTLTLWKDGVFSVDDGESPVVPRNPNTDPDARRFIESVMRGQLPDEFSSAVDLDVVDKRGEEFKAPPMKSFSGAGHRLGSAVPDVVNATPSSTSEATAPRPPPTTTVDESQPVTKVQIRLADGTRLVARFNPTHTVAAMREFVAAALPVGESRPWVFMTTFPNRVITDEEQTLEAAKLCNAAVVQKWQ